MKPIDPEGLCEELHAALVSELEDAIPNAQAVGDHIDALIMGRLGWARAQAGGATVSERERAPCVPGSVVERFASILQHRGIADLFLAAPCVFCGYDGESYWQKNRHGEQCPFRGIGGEYERALKLPSLFLPATGDGTVRLRPRSEDGRRGFQDGMLQACRLLGFGNANDSLEALVEFIRSEARKWDAAEELQEKLAAAETLNGLVTEQCNYEKRRAEKAEDERDGLRAWLTEHGSFVVDCLRSESRRLKDRHAGYDYGPRIAALLAASESLDALTKEAKP